MILRLLVVAGVIFGQLATANSWPHPDDLQCKKLAETENVCETYKWCIYQGQLMGSYELSYLKSTCSNRAMNEYDLSDDELSAILEEAL